MKKSVFLRSVIFGFWFMLAIYSNLHAADGQIDILPNGSEALTISQPGSYVLTGDVTMTANVSCISITADDVTLDLNGHVITGFGSTSYGIRGELVSNTRIMNGVVKNFGMNGIYLGSECSIEKVKVSACGLQGVRAGDNANIVSVTARENHDDGIKAENNSIVRNCIAENNGGVGKGVCGIIVGYSSTVQGCLSSNNRSGATDQSMDIYGINAGVGCIITDNVCNGNTNETSYNGRASFGIRAQDECVIRNNVCRDNIAYGRGTSVAGISAGSRCIIVHNTVSVNKAYGEYGMAYGIACSDACKIEGNVCANNNARGADSWSYGINAFSYCRVVGNTCYNNEGVEYSIGIYGNNGGVRIEDNHCSGHSTGTNSFGIKIRNLTSNALVIRNACMSNATDISMGNASNYCAENITEDAIADTSNVTMGTGDRANVEY